MTKTSVKLKSAASMAKYSASTIRTKDMHVCITKGNTKLGSGIYTFSTLPGDKDHMLRSKTGELLCDGPFQSCIL